MRKLTNLGSEAIQRHTILFEESTIELTIRFFPKQQIWAADIVYNGIEINGVKLSCGVAHIISSNLPFDFFVVDESTNGLDPFQRTDFSSGRCSIYLLERSDVESVRNLELPE